MNQNISELLVTESVSRRPPPIQMLMDLYNIGSLDEKICRDIVDRLLKIDAFSSSHEVIDTIQSIFDSKDEESADSVINTLSGIENEEIPRVLKLVKAWVNEEPSRKEAFTTEVFEQIENNLNLLLVDIPVIQTMVKAQGLLRAVGNEFEHVKIVCDYRPVFDDSRQKIEYLSLIANMRLIYTSQDGGEHASEFALTKDELIAIRDSVDDAVRKLEIMEDLRSRLNTKLSVERTTNE